MFTMFHKIRTPLFSFYNFSKWSVLVKIISLFATNVSYGCKKSDLEHTTRTGVQEQNQGCPRATRTHCHWRVVNDTSVCVVAGGGQFGHFSLLTLFLRVLFLTVCWLVKMHVMCCNA